MARSRRSLKHGASAGASRKPANPRQQLGNMLSYWRFWRKVSDRRPHVGHSPFFAAGRVSSLSEYKQRDGGRHASADADLEQSIESRLDRVPPPSCAEIRSTGTASTGLIGG
jgi:hypothetical protein